MSGQSLEATLERVARVEASKPRLLDLFCGAGGAAMGYHRAGFEVVGVDIRPQPSYPFEFFQFDALDCLRSLADMPGSYDAIHASPPCQRYSSLAALHPDDEHPDLIAPVRELLEATCLPYVMENVVGAPLREPAMLCGSSLGLRVRRHRLFETNWPLLTPPCQHGTERALVGVYGASDGQKGCFKADTRNPTWKRGPRQVTTVEAREIMEMPWVMERKGLTEAIPPAYTELIGHQLMQHIAMARSASAASSAPQRTTPKKDSDA